MMAAPRTKSQKGTAIVESAITLLFLLMLLFGIMEAGRLYQVQQTLTDAAREGARLAVAPLTKTNTLGTVAEITTRVNLFLDSASISGATVTVSPDPPSAAAQFTEVTVRAPYQIITLSIFSPLQITLQGKARMRNETAP